VQGCQLNSKRTLRKRRDCPGQGGLSLFLFLSPFGVFLLFFCFLLPVMPESASLVSLPRFFLLLRRTDLSPKETSLLRLSYTRGEFLTPSAEAANGPKPGRVYLECMAMGYCLVLPFMERCYGCTRRRRQMAARKRRQSTEYLYVKYFTQMYGVHIPSNQSECQIFVRGCPGLVCLGHVGSCRGWFTAATTYGAQIQVHRVFLARTGKLLVGFSIVCPPLFFILQALLPKPPAHSLL
jgi:hypothetical protein